MIRLDLEQAMNQSKLVSAQFKAPLRSLALTVEETAPGDFRWRILEGRGNPPVFESIGCANRTFSAYDAALATGYGELQRVVGPDLQYGPRAAPDAVVNFIRIASAPPPRPVERADPLKSPPVTNGGFTSRLRRPS